MPVYKAEKFKLGHYLLFRPFGACSLSHFLSHGLRRGLRSCAASRLTQDPLGLESPGVETPGYCQAPYGRVSLATDHWPLITDHCLLASISQTRRMVSRWASLRVRNSNP